MNQNRLPYVSIIIPTYKDWARLQLCLKALCLQTYPSSSFEVIVVNNNADDLVPDDLICPVSTTLINEIKPGSYAARNAGLAISKGQIIGFTDSDCIPDINWIANAVSMMSAEGYVDRITGPVNIFMESGGSVFAWEFESITAFNQKRNVKKGVSVTANLFVKKTAFDQVGNFDSALYSGGDIEWNKRATALGLGIVFSDDVLVMHPARSSFREILAKSRRVAGGGYVTAKRQKRLVLYILRHLVPPVRYIGVLINDEGNNIKDVVFAGLVFWCLKLMMVFEILRLHLGGKPVR
ncbi:MAG TPA: glycosyltransferase [Methylotenera sp.]